MNPDQQDAYDRLSLRPSDDYSQSTDAWQVTDGINVVSATPNQIYGDLEAIGLSQMIIANNPPFKLQTRNVQQTQTGSGTVTFTSQDNFPVLVKKLLLNFDFNNLTSTGSVTISVTATRVTNPTGPVTTPDVSSLSINLTDPDRNANDLFASLDLWAPLRNYNDSSSSIENEGRNMNSLFVMRASADVRLAVGDLTSIAVAITAPANVTTTLTLLSANSPAYGLDANDNTMEGLGRKLTEFASI